MVGSARSRAPGPISSLQMSSGWWRRIERRSARLICWRYAMRWTGSPGAQGPAVCKGYYAAYVKEITPNRYRISAIFCVHNRHLPSYSVDFAVDAQPIEAYLHLRAIEATHGKGKNAGSEERGARARRRAQSHPRSRPRRLVRRQSILRCEGPSPGALRDGAAPPGRRRCNQRSRLELRGHPANFLQGPECPAGRWACRPATEPTRPQGRPQGLRRRDCLRGRSQRQKTRTDDFAMSRRDRDALRHQGASAQPGACAGAQKKRLNPA
jgi:hypothetical protein